MELPPALRVRPVHLPFPLPLPPGTTSMGDVMESMGLNEVFNVSLHVPALRVDEVVKVLRSLDVFALGDIPQAVDLLTTIASKVRGQSRGGHTVWEGLGRQTHLPQASLRPLAIPTLLGQSAAFTLHNRCCYLELTRRPACWRLLWELEQKVVSGCCGSKFTPTIRVLLLPPPRDTSALSFPLQPSAGGAHQEAAAVGGDGAAGGAGGAEAAPGALGAGAAGPVVRRRRRARRGHGR